MGREHTHRNALPSSSRHETKLVDRGHVGILHARLCTGDVSAREEVTGLLLSRLARYLSYRWPGLDDGVFQDAAEDALLAYFECPTKYLPERAPLESFLRLAALNNLKDAMRRNRRRLLHEIAVGGDLPDRSVPDLGTVQPRRDLGALFRAAAQTDSERAFLCARLGGERRTQGLAQVLGVSDRPRAEQRAEINRVWTRLKLRIRRKLDKRPV
jgi:DNA-directed RNA polymerase specialized sigma24 family protein